MAGTPDGKASADYIYNEWKKQELDVVKMLDYDVLLEYPDEIKFNK